MEPCPDHNEPSPRLLVALAKSLGVLALAPSSQQSILEERGLAPITDELALSLADLVPFLDSFVQQGWLAESDAELVRGIDTLFGSMSTDKELALWQVQDLDHPDWQVVRSLAARFFVHF